MKFGTNLGEKLAGIVASEPDTVVVDVPLPKHRPQPRTRRKPMTPLTHAEIVARQRDAIARARQREEAHRLANPVTFAITKPR